MWLFREKLQVSGGFWLLLGWFLYANGWQLLAAVLAAAVLHESGHWLALRLMGARVASVEISVFGAEMRTVGRLSYGGELLAVLAGPAVNLAAGVLLAAAGEPWLEAAGAQVVLGLFNLLPVRPLDGGRALALAVSWAAGPAAGEQAAECVSFLTASLLACGTVWLMIKTEGSLWLLPAVVGFAASAGRELAGKRTFL